MILDHPGGPIVITKTLQKRGRRLRVREEDMTMEAEVRERFENAGILALKVEEGIIH